VTRSEPLLHPLKALRGSKRLALQANLFA